MFNWLKQVVRVLLTKEHDAELLRFARAEYRKDWEHAYHMLSQGKKPFEGV